MTDKITHETAHEIISDIRSGAMLGTQSLIELCDYVEKLESLLNPTNDQTNEGKSDE